MKECKCTLAQRMVGDGCSVCNPAKSLEYADETIVELEAEVERLRGHAKRLMRASRQLLNDSRQQPRDYAREAIARYLEDYPEEAER